MEIFTVKGFYGKVSCDKIEKKLGHLKKIWE